MKSQELKSDKNLTNKGNIKMKNILDINTRKEIIKEILGEENKARKEESYKRFEVWKNKHSKYILDALNREFSKDTVKNMRTVTSINIVKRIINSKSSIYKQKPKRIFNNASEELSAYIENIYQEALANVKLKKSNKILNLEDQALIQIVPKDGKLELITYYPHNYDVVPDDVDPEKAQAYIISSFDKETQVNALSGNTSLNSGYVYGNQKQFSDNINQIIADPDDYKLKQMRMVWWSDRYHFTTNGLGDVIDPDTNDIAGNSFDVQNVVNPIEKMPFIDIAKDKDFEYFVNTDSTLVQFCIELGVVLSDTSNINRLQGYSQAIIKSVEKPQDLQVGPHSVIHLPIDPTKPEISPDFSFVSPNPDLQSSLSLLNTFINLYLSSEGLDSKTISTDGQVKQFASGLERLLAMVDRFEASQDDFDLYESVEQKAFDLLKAWNNYLVSKTTDNAGVDYVNQTIPDDVMLEIEFAGPEAIETNQEKQGQVLALYKEGLMSKKMAIMQTQSLTEDEAENIIEDIEEEKQMAIPIKLIQQDNQQEDNNNGESN